MSASTKKPILGYSYFLGVQYGLCHGPIDKITRIRSENRVIEEGEFLDGETISIYKPDLYGPDDAVIGDVDFAFGEPTQTQNPYLLGVQPVASENIPAYRGIACVILNQVNLGMRPQLRPWEFRAQRIHKSTRGAVQWYDDKSEIVDFDTVGEGLTFSERFNSGIEGYEDNTDSPGYLSNFTIISDDFGNAIRIVAPFPSNGYISKSITQVDITSLKIKFKIEAISDDDVGSFSVFDSIGNSILSVIPFRQKSIDSLQRCQMNSGFLANGEFLSSSVLDVDKWYRVEVQVDREASTIDAQLYVDSTSTLVGSISDISISSNLIANEIRWNTEGAAANPNNGAVIFDEVEIYSYALTGDMNPAHIIRECLTDINWGLGYTASDIDDTAFTLAADALFDEEFGLSLLWSQSTEIEDFIRDILRHVDGVLYVHPRTGKFTLKLIRDDYVAASLPILDESNIISISDYKKPTIGELTNYVTIKYWDRATSEDSSISVQDIALAQQQGSIVSSVIPMPGITRGTLASRVAARELNSLSNPLITCTIIANREAASLNIGDAFKLSWPKFGLSETIMRVTNAQFGTLQDGRVKIECVQDVFGLPQAVFSEPTDSSFVSPINAPTNSPFRLVQESNYYTLIQEQGEDFTFDPLDGFLITAATQPSQDAIEYRIWTDESGSYVRKQASDFCPTATITHDFPRVVNGVIQTVVGITGLSTDDVTDIDIGSIAQINNEFLEVISVSTTSLTCGRAVVDSPIEDHVSGDRIFFWGDNFYGKVDTLYQDNDTIGVKITPTTGQGELAIADATEQTLTFDQRAYRAWLPGNIAIGGSYFPSSVEGVETVDSSWAHRDRTLQTAGLNDFTEASIGPEVGTTYTTTLTRVNTSAQLDQNTGTTGTTDSLDPAGYDGLVRFDIVSVRDALDSYHTHSHEFIVTRTSALQEEQGLFLFTEDNEAIITES